MKARARHAAPPDAPGPSFAFYLEPDGTVIAADLSRYRDAPQGRVFEGLAALKARANGPVAWTSFTASYLDLCIRISENEARRRHPALFERIPNSA